MSCESHIPINWRMQKIRYHLLGTKLPDGKLFIGYKPPEYANNFKIKQPTVSIEVYNNTELEKAAK